VLVLHDYAGLGNPGRLALERAFGDFTTLQHVLDWGQEADPRIEVDEIITMDEYTHDVLVRLPDQRYLAFDTT